jgi:hypothetical protein
LVGKRGALHIIIFDELDSIGKVLVNEKNFQPGFRVKFSKLGL